MDLGHPEIDLLEIYKKGEMAYFQLPTLVHKDSTRRLGRMILQDLKAVSDSLLNDVEVDEDSFFSIFIDEFGYFAIEDFDELLAQCRESQLGLHLFTQSLADLDKISPEFARKILDNTIYKIIFRQDDPKSVEIWSSIAGTRDTVNESFQVESSDFNMSQIKTGIGNLREAKVMQIEHDVFKRLNVGQAVFIEKSPYRDDLVQIFYNPKVNGELR